MNKKQTIALVLVLAVLAGIFWLLQGTNQKNLQRKEVIVDVKDNFEK